MANRAKIDPMLNNTRLDIISKGFFTIQDLQKFIPLSYQRAKQEYYSICHELALKGKKVPDYGIEANYVLNYLGMDRKMIEHWAEYEVSKKEKVESNSENS